MMILFTFILCLFVHSSRVNAQNNVFNHYDPSEQIKIYSIFFSDTGNGWAESLFGDVLKTSDGGKTWQLNSKDQYRKFMNAIRTTNKGSWSANIFCAVLKSTDDGESWIPYSNKQEKHICNVYFKDENTGWKVAEEFLKNVTKSIKESFEEDNINLNTGVINQCREYYTNIDERWILGWCYKNLILY